MWAICWSVSRLRQPLPALISSVTQHQLIIISLLDIDWLTRDSRTNREEHTLLKSITLWQVNYYSLTFEKLIAHSIFQSQPPTAGWEANGKSYDARDAGGWDPNGDTVMTQTEERDDNYKRRSASPGDYNRWACHHLSTLLSLIFILVPRVLPLDFHLELVREVKLFLRPSLIRVWEFSVYPFVPPKEI